MTNSENSSSEASRSPNWALYALILPAIFVVADQVSKFWALDFFKNKFGTPINICADPEFGGVSHEVSTIFDLTLLCNRGVSFSMFGGEGDIKRWVLSAFALIVTAFLIYYVSKVKDRLSALSFAFIIGGSLGNVIDRIRFGAVVDFLDFSEIKFNYVFNIADSCITAGVIGLILAAIFIKEEPEEPPKP